MLIKEMFMRIIHPKNFWMAASEIVFFVNIFIEHCFFRGTRWRSSLRHCATSRKVAELEFNGIFHRQNPSGRTMALGLTQPLTKMSTRNISWGVKRPVRKPDTLSPSCVNCLEIGEPQPL